MRKKKDWSNLEQWDKLECGKRKKTPIFTSLFEVLPRSGFGGGHTSFSGPASIEMTRAHQAVSADGRDHVRAPRAGAQLRKTTRNLPLRRLNNRYLPFHGVERR